MEHENAEPHVFPNARRPGELLFAMLFLAMGLVLLSLITQQTQWLAGKGLAAQPRIWPLIGVGGMAFFGALHLWSTSRRQGEAGIERGIEKDEALELEQLGILAEKERVHGSGESFGPYGLCAIGAPERIGEQHGLVQARAGHPEIHQLAGHDRRRIDKTGLGCRWSSPSAEACRRAWVLGRPKTRDE